MKKPKFNKKIILPIILGVILIVGFFALFPITKTRAADTPKMVNDIATGKMGENVGAAISDPLGTIAKGIFRWLGSLVFKLGMFILNVSLSFFDFMLKMGLEGQSDIARVGWTVCRDIANMFFILFMVVIAFATILRIERYGVKQLLPKVIIIALLINFSMVLCFVLIDFTNIAANYFITNAQVGASGTRVSLAQVFLDGLQITRTLTAANCQMFIAQQQDCDTEYASTEDRNKCFLVYQQKFEICTSEIANVQRTATEEEDFWHEADKNDIVESLQQE